MGLRTSHGAYQGPYSLYHRWQVNLARAAGYDIGRDHTGEYVALDWGGLHRENPDHLYGDWTSMPEDPLVVLLAHAPEGVLRAAHAEPIAARLEEILPNVQDAGEHDDRCGRYATQRFVAGLRAAALAGEDVEFL